jgi:hypothetical protein
MRNEQMLSLASLARPLFVGETLVTAALVVPHKHARTELILASAKRIVTTLKPHRKFLAESGIDPARIDRLRLEAARLKKVFDAAAAIVADRGVPTHRMRELFVVAAGDAATLNRLAAAAPPGVLNPDLWKHSRRVGKRMGRPRKPRQSGPE